MPDYVFVRVDAEADGESLIEDVSGNLVRTDFARSAQPTFPGGIQPSNTSLFFSTLPNWDGDWHRFQLDDL